MTRRTPRHASGTRQMGLRALDFFGMPHWVNGREAHEQPKMTSSRRLVATRQGHLTPKLGRPYTAAVFSSPTQIRQLEASVRRLMPERDVTLEPRFFLASLSQAWMARVVVLR